jgi:hypothetical protein
MNPKTLILSAALALGALPAAAHAQFTIPWSTIDAGGGGPLSGGAFTLSGTIGQPDAAEPLTAGALRLTGGYWPGTLCPADFNGQNGVELLDIFAFLNAWFTGDPAADFNGLNGVELLDIFAFLNAWFSGC